ncbi:kinesin-associated protein 3 isoform X2 [Mycetomoellerius zeteki]|uniref:kinesin-associated protein 3 isoform X2 n=1 Tax=Mycetomoellerius zeteki TaxID=64791 RepID=UPI00084EC7AB|nr:PREDICTED: kinesin-associated protein 3 isoform X2 [Trachymyrmex zeteki]
MDEAKFLKRKVRSGTLDVHPTEKALVVNYDVEALILGELGDPMLGDRKECQKVIRLKSLNADTNVSLLAKEVIEKCTLIHESKLREVEQLIYYLQNRRNNDTSTGSDSNSQPPRPASSNSLITENSEVERAVISNVDSYIELLYEEIPGKIKGSSLILQLARVPDNLLELTKNESLLSALARVLREDWRRSIELSTNIIYIFFCFSTYSQFHNIVLEYRIGSLCMDIIDSELRRYDQWKEDMEKRRKQFENTTGLTFFPVGNNDNCDRKIRIIDDIWNMEGPLDYEVKRRSVEVSITVSESDVKKLKEELEKSRKKFKSLTKKQEQLLRVAFYLLLNIAENAMEVERKMRKKNVIGMLIKTLDRTNTDLLILVVTFLKKLSIFRENKDLMIEENIVDKLPRLLQNNNADLVLSTLKLLFNLSFDAKLRARMIRVGMLPKWIKLFSQDMKNKSTIVGLLYHTSMDDKVKAMFTNTDCISMVTNMILNSEDEHVRSELIALGINLAINNKNAQLMVENNRLQGLIKIAFRNQDALVMKMIRNISQHDSTKENFVEFVGDFAMALTQSDSQDFVLEVIGALGNLELPDLDYSQIIQRCNLIPWIRNNLVPGKAQDDIVLEIVIFLGTAARDEDCARLLCKADILLSLIELLKAKQEDDEMVLQIIYIFYQIAKHDSTRDYLIRETGNEAPGYLIDLMHDKNPAIRKVCDICLDVIAICDKNWAVRIKVEKFRSHNQQWLEMVESIGTDSINHMLPDDDDSLSPFISGDLLKHTILFPSGNIASFNVDDGFSTMKHSSESSENPSRPVSRYRDLDEIGELMARSKSRMSVASGIEDLYYSSRVKFNEADSSHILI